MVVRSGSVEQRFIGLIRGQQNINGREHPLPDSRSVQVALAANWSHRMAAWIGASVPCRFTSSWAVR
jgi:hypothetical protein